MRMVRELALAIAATLLASGCSKSTEPTSQPGPAPASNSAAKVTPPAAAPLATTKAAGTQVFDPTVLDADGYIRQWLILGPINFGDDYNAENIDKDQIPNEGAMTPKAGDTVKVTTAEGEPGAYKSVQKELTWKAVTPEDHVVDFNVALGLDTSDSCGGYAVAYLEAPEEMRAITFSLSSNDNGKIFLNGKSIYTYVGGRALAEDADIVEDLTLNKGTNVLIFKVWNDSNNWQECLRLLTKDDKPVKNVKVRLAK
jgi:hypothetical protein